MGSAANHAEGRTKIIDIRFSMAQHTHTQTKQHEGSTRRHRTHQGEHGAAFVELAISFVVFLSLFFLSIDVLRLGYHNALAQFIVTRAVQEGALLNASPTDRCTAVVQNVRGLITDFGLDDAVTDPNNDIKIIQEIGAPSSAGACDPNLPGGTGPGEAGRPQEFFGIVLSYNIALNVGIIFQFNHRVTAVAIARNEPAGTD